MPEFRRSITGQHILYLWLTIGLIVGLVVHIVGYALLTATSGEPIGLVADLLSTLGTALWTGVVLVVFAEVLPQAQRRAALRLLHRYEEALREQAVAGVGEVARPAEAPVDGRTAPPRA